MFRYWDGHAWSAALSPTPNAAPPSQGFGQPAEEAGQYGSQPASGQTQPGTYRPGSYGAGQQPGGQPNYAQQNYGQQSWSYQASQQSSGSGKKRAIGWWIGGGILALVLIVVGVLVIRNLTGGSLKNNAEPGGAASHQACPTTTKSPVASPDHSTDSMVHGGPVAYPRLSSPWRPPHGDDRVPFGSDVKTQDIVIERQYQPGQSWVASVLVGRLQAGDGFFTPKQGSKIVAKCIASGAFYGDNPVKRHDQKSKSMKVDGHKAWYLKSHLSFDIKGLEAKGETMIIVIIEAGDSNGLYYASIPDNAKQYLSPAEKLISKLKITS